MSEEYETGNFERTIEDMLTKRKGTNVENFWVCGFKGWAKIFYTWTSWTGPLPMNGGCVMVAQCPVECPRGEDEPEL